MHDRQNLGRLIGRMPEVCAPRDLVKGLRITHQTLERWQESPGFPAPFRFTSRCRRWLRDDIAAWLLARTRDVRTPRRKRAEETPNASA
jgi:hypothetical protein